MTFKEALKEIKNNYALIGKKVKGGTIDELIIYPSDESSKEIYKDLYLKTYDAEKSIEPFKNEDVLVSAIINKKLITQKFFITSNLDEIYNELKN
jgi:hypothetical protein